MANTKGFVPKEHAQSDVATIMAKMGNGQITANDATVQLINLTDRIYAGIPNTTKAKRHGR